VTFLDEIPPGYDDRTRLAVTSDNRIIATHPEHPPVVYDEAARQWVPVAPLPKVE
jgi:hypothetical protein